MRGLSRAYILVITAVVLFLPCASAYKLELGARPVGMGGSFVAVADDVNALGWNVGGLAYLSEGSLIISRENLFGLEIPLDFLTVAIPSRKLGTFGFSLSSLKFDSNHAGYEDMEIRTGWARNFSIPGRGGLPNWCGIGLLLRANTVKAYGDREASGSNLSLEVGYIQQYSPKVNLGMVVKTNDLYSKWVIKNGEQNLPSLAQKEISIDLGLAIKIGLNGLVAFDLRNLGGLRFASCGFEYSVSKVISLRTGLSGSGFSCGVSLKQGAWNLDYAFLPNTIGNANKINLVYNF